MSREVVGAADPDAAARSARPTTPSTTPPTTPPTMRPTGTGAAATDPGAPPAGTHGTDRLTGRRWRRPALLLALATLAGGLAGWDGAGSWRAAQQRELALRATTAAATVVGYQDTGSGEPATPGDGAGGSGSGAAGRTATLVVRVTNLTDVPLDVYGGGAGFSAVRTRFVEPSGARLAPRGRLVVRIAVEVACASPQALSVPPLRVLLPDGVAQAVPLDAAAGPLGTLCAATVRGAVPLVAGAAVRARTDVAAVVDGGRLRISLVAPSGRTTRLVGIRAGGLTLTATPIPLTVDGTERVVWIDPPRTCPEQVRRGGLPQVLDLDVDAGSGQAGTVRLDLGDALARWLLDGACGRPGDDRDGKGVG